MNSKHPTLFGRPPLFEGEDPKMYDQLLTKVFAAMGPTDILQEILAHDYGYDQMEMSRYRRLKAELIKVNSYKGLAETLAPLVGRSRADTLANGWAAQKSEVVEEVKQILASAGLNTDSILAHTFSIKLDDIERMDRLMTMAQARRNAVPHEIHQHRQTLQKLAAERLEHDKMRLVESASVDGTKVE